MARVTVDEAEAILGPELTAAAIAAAPQQSMPPERVEILAALLEQPVKAALSAA